MEADWVLLKKETRRRFASATWVPLRASLNEENGDSQYVGYTCDVFACGSVAFLPQYKETANELSWSDIGLSSNVRPYAYKDGNYSSIEQFQINDNEPIGIHLVFEHPQPVVGGTKWILNPDLVVALGLIKEGNSWVRPEENFIEVAREIIDSDGSHKKIEIKREFLMDYLAARGLSLRLSTYQQRVEIVTRFEGSQYADLTSYREERDGGKFGLLVRNLDEIYGGGWASFRVWRTDVDEDEDAPVMGPENEENTDSESSEGHRTGYEGVRIEGEFWRDEWIEHQGVSVRVRRDPDPALPSFIVETDGRRIASKELDNEDVGRWLWFRPSIVPELLNLRGFKLEWYTAETGGIRSTSGYVAHFGVNSADLVTVYAYDVARLDSWEQHIWAGHNVVPEGRVSSELLASQVKVQPASTKAPEEKFLKCMRMLEWGFREKLGVALFIHDIDDKAILQQVSRFHSRDRTSLLRLAKDIVRVFSDRLNVRELRKLSTNAEKEKLGSNKLLEDILAQKIGADRSREIFGVIVGAYDMRVGDAHPTGSKVTDAIKLAGVDERCTYIRQGEQLINNIGYTIWLIGKLLFGENN
jgi:hypothetical protein